ncbi:interferon-induced transmembrane protein 1-like [Rhineura floridana]|uniref:interferon-induced transmembrane protein 1-like n=1 Tax=Rhineura floridana TaxID=261503 RepID=UPI002AC827D0|nr:interferon-induced transmembrane protein 1-like [Rhineura floridana]XP_061469053.1 interferon-induced transmembrane protein 1-like [Rhineura floridana]XP_061469054.1 interferon-induced transmembrane protein 1-like [Rhineura floridana]XP_061469055.1 interferon-induced transmembrane protein 1-like [Rhineura floridana]
MEPAISLNMRPYDVKLHGDTATFYPYPLGIVAQPPKDYVLWSLFNFSFMNTCCLGFAALVFSIKTRDCKLSGYDEGAAKYSKRAKLLNIIASVLGIVFFILIFLMTVSVVVVLQERLQQLIKEYREKMEEFLNMDDGSEISSDPY